MTYAKNFDLRFLDGSSQGSSSGKSETSSITESSGCYPRIQVESELAGSRGDSDEFYMDSSQGMSMLPPIPLSSYGDNIDHASVVSSSDASPLPENPGSQSSSDWITRLSQDKSLRKPSHHLKFLIKQALVSHSAKGDLWKNIVYTLNKSLRKLIETIYPYYGKHWKVVFDSEDIVFFHKGVVKPRIDTEQENIVYSLLSLYYISLERTLIFETQRLNHNSHNKLLSNNVFHRALFSICCECVVKTFHPRLSTESILSAMEIDAYDMFKAMECFMRNMSQPLPCDYDQPGFSDSRNIEALLLPDEMKQYLLRRESEILDAGLWISLPHGISRGMVDAIAFLHQVQSDGAHPKAWPPMCLVCNSDIDDADEVNNIPLDISIHNLDKTRSKHDLPVELVFRKTLRIFARRTLQLGYKLKATDVLIQRIWVAIRHFLRNHIYVLYDHHIDHILLCCFYATCKVTLDAPVLSFANIVKSYHSVYRSRGELYNRRIVECVLLEREDDGTEVFGNIIQFYNRIFIPIMQTHFVKSTDQKFMAEQKTKTNRIIEDIKYTAKFDECNNVSMSIRGVSKLPLAIDGVQAYIVEEENSTQTPRGQVVHCFGL